ncbi:hypothetical protein Y032_0053g2334 [Ancylostoma ceylanicum]|uniref:Uncharacterized protein n=1 Tax=Ancylostoma ceylanicum TaxID=53326 RepID=A0A016U6Q2_9BILA|nr:hypothetical protein Y032_0053g2334 [Ancylostoma ceylanicum]
MSFVEQRHQSTVEFRRNDYPMSDEKSFIVEGEGLTEGVIAADSRWRFPRAFVSAYVVDNLLQNVFFAAFFSYHVHIDGQQLPCGLALTFGVLSSCGYDDVFSWHRLLRYASRQRVGLSKVRRPSIFDLGVISSEYEGPSQEPVSRVCR